MAGSWGGRISIVPVNGATSKGLRRKFLLKVQPERSILNVKLASDQLTLLSTAEPPLYPLTL